MKISVTVKSKAKEQNIKQVNDNTLIVAVTEAPEKGKANNAVVKMLAEYYNVNQSSVFIVSGKTSKHKIIEISGKEA